MVKVPKKIEKYSLSKLSSDELNKFSAKYQDNAVIVVEDPEPESDEIKIQCQSLEGECTLRTACRNVLTPEEALEKANNTPYGLSAGIWTEKGSLIHWMAERLRAGVIWANTFNKFDPASPFGGYKESGFGREGGMQGLGAYLKNSGGRS